MALTRIFASVLRGFSTGFTRYHAQEQQRATVAAARAVMLRCLEFGTERRPDHPNWESPAA